MIGFLLTILASKHKNMANWKFSNNGSAERSFVNRAIVRNEQVEKMYDISDLYLQRLVNCSELILNVIR